VGSKALDMGALLKYMGKKILVSCLFFLYLMTSGVFAQGLEIQFYQALKGQEISIVDSNGTIVETTTIDAMGNAKFSNDIEEGQQLTMNLSEAEDTETTNARIVYGIPVKNVIIIVLLVGIGVFAVTYYFIRRTIYHEYEQLIDYAYNERYDSSL
jgi:hypothetical protein